MNNIELLANQIQLDEWTEEAKKDMYKVAEIIECLSERHSIGDIEMLADFIDKSSDTIGIILCRMLNKKIRIMKSEPDDPECERHKPLSLKNID